jgi:magnesium transporter
MTPYKDRLSQPIMSVARKDFAALPQRLTVQQALDAVRHQGVGEKIIYFYLVDDDDRLVGVLPTRRLLTSPLHQPLSEIMISRVVAVPQTGKVLDACEEFVVYRFLALPVVDNQRRIVGVVDASLLTDEVFDIDEREQTDELFETIGFHVEQLRGASPLRAFRFRFPWLLATVASGIICAFVASAYEVTLTTTVMLAFFLTLVLGLGESVSSQSMMVTIQALRLTMPTFRWYVRAFRRETSTAMLLGVAFGAMVTLIVWLWRGDGVMAFVIGGSILMVLFAACFFGLTVPAILHASKLDLKVSAGPVTLAVTDISTILFYLGLASIFL